MFNIFESKYDTCDVPLLNSERKGAAHLMRRQFLAIYSPSPPRVAKC